MTPPYRVYTAIHPDGTTAVVYAIDADDAECAAAAHWRIMRGEIIVRYRYGVAAVVGGKRGGPVVLDKRRMRRAEVVKYPMESYIAQLIDDCRKCGFWPDLIDKAEAELKAIASARADFVHRIAALEQWDRDTERFCKELIIRCSDILKLNPPVAEVVE